MFQLVDTGMIPLKWKLRLTLGYSVLLMPVNLQAEKGVAMLAGVINHDYQGEVALLLHSK